MDDEAKETNSTTSINIVSTNRLIKDETFSSSLKVLKTQMKKYAKKLTNKIKEESPAEAENFKKNLEAALQKIFAKYEHLQFFTGASDEFEGEGMLAIAEYRDKKPFMLFFKHGLKEERVVSLSSCIKTFFQIFSGLVAISKYFLYLWGEIHPSIPPVTSWKLTNRSVKVLAWGNQISSKRRLVWNDSRLFASPTPPPPPHPLVRRLGRGDGWFRETAHLPLPYGNINT